MAKTSDNKEKQEITPQLVEQVAEKVYALLQREGQIESERKRLTGWRNQQGGRR